MNSSSLGGTAAFLGVLTVLIALSILAGVGWFIYRYNKVRRREISGIERLKLDSMVEGYRAKAAEPSTKVESTSAVFESGDAKSEQAPNPIRRSTRRPPQDPDALPQHSLR